MWFQLETKIFRSPYVQGHTLQDDTENMYARRGSENRGFQLKIEIWLDTWIVITRRRRPIFLQSYHHVGAVMGMWLVMQSRSSAGYLFIVENSFIHTIMYTYYALNVLGYRFRLKFVITTLQMTQFVIGLVMGPYQLWTYYECISAIDAVCYVYHEVYAAYLLYLFLQFYQKTYAKKSRKAGEWMVETD